QISVVALDKPDDPEELTRVAIEARGVIQRAGGNLQMSADLEVALGEVDVGQGRDDDAIRRLDKARDQLSDAGEVARARAASWLEIEALLDRNRAGDLDRAES